MSLTKVSRARSQTDQPQPIRNVKPANRTSELVKTEPASETITSADATAIALRSPNRETSHPAGTSKERMPIPRSATTSPATAGDAPRSRAARATIGMTAPCATEKSSVGR